MRKIPFIFPALALLSACATPPRAPVLVTVEEGSLADNMGKATASAAGDTRDGLAEAAMSPLQDLNLNKREIPPVLRDADTPYDLPPDLTCLDIERLLGPLNAALGPDWDTPVPDDRLRTEKLADSASEAALGAIASEARGLIPFRSLVRKASGAETYEKKYNQAYRIGAQRRAYLKGMGQAKGCPLPARPNPVPQKRDDIVFKGDSPEPAPVPVSPLPPPPPPPMPGPAATTSSPPTPPAVESEALETVPRQSPF